MSQTVSSFTKQVFFCLVGLGTFDWAFHHPNSQLTNSYFFRGAEITNHFEIGLEIFEIGKSMAFSNCGFSSSVFFNLRVDQMTISTSQNG